METKTEPNINQSSESVDEVREGFTTKSLVAAFFVGLVVLPGVIYLGLINGPIVGGVAQWLTVILFLELTKRSLQHLTKQEIYIISLVAMGLVTEVGFALYGGVFAKLIWDQYFIQSPAVSSFALTGLIPKWVVPQIGSKALELRTFIHKDWIIPILLTVVGFVFYRINIFGLGYPLYVLTRKIEKLPFPMAPVSVEGTTALVDSQYKEGSWRWRVFSIGGIIGVFYGLLYTAIPIITGIFKAEPLMLIPIPFVDFTDKLSSILPAAAFGFMTDLGSFLVGFILPFWVVFGIFTSSLLINLVFNPLLYKYGILHTWKPGMTVIPTTICNSIDFWLSITIGVGLAIGIIGIISVTRTIGRTKNDEQRDITELRTKELPLTTSIFIWIISTLLIIWLCHILVPKFPVWIFFVFGFIFTPLLSYVSSRMFGITGVITDVSFPMVREASYILSGYNGADIWFAPVPYNDVGGATQRFTELSLLRTKFVSWIKAEIVVFIILFICSFIYWTIIWSLGPIPSSLYPFAQKMWPYYSTMRALWISTTVEGGAHWILQSIKPLLIIGGGIGAFIIYGLISLLGLPLQFFYGLVGGLTLWPHHAVLMFFGALLGRYFFAKKFGKEAWSKYAPILLAGYGCGIGIIGMIAISITLITKTVAQMLF